MAERGAQISAYAPLETEQIAYAARPHRYFGSISHDAEEKLPNLCFSEGIFAVSFLLRLFIGFSKMLLVEPRRIESLTS